eukprot:comp16582_c0_seq1/m.14705 comp16582_c0_seq1/g.14705  ORF comp16582_c0_seq1/g.14705 comp16582_c0_seq1/m.14705 type:complete len:145 (-) comp16582_c0_seq1:289-723(-)
MLPASVDSLRYKRVNQSESQFEEDDAPPYSEVTVHHGTYLGSAWIAAVTDSALSSRVQSVLAGRTQPSPVRVEVADDHVLLAGLRTVRWPTASLLAAAQPGGGEVVAVVQAVGARQLCHVLRLDGCRSAEALLGALQATGVSLW